MRRARHRPHRQVQRQLRSPTRAHQYLLYGWGATGGFLAPENLFDVDSEVSCDDSGEEEEEERDPEGEGLQECHGDAKAVGQGQGQWHGVVPTTRGVESWWS